MLITSSIKIDDHNLYYDSFGQGSVIILLHGLFGSKEQWHNIIKTMSNGNYRIIAVDLPGYGKSEGTNYRLQNQVYVLHQFIKQMHLHHINIAGNSMGGLIAALYAKKYPSDINTIALIGAPWGIEPPIKSPTDRLLLKGINPLIPTNKLLFNEEMHILFNKPHQFDKAKINRITDKYKLDYNKNIVIWNLLTKYRDFFNKKFEIDAPIFIVWGDDDRIFDKSGANILKKNIKKSVIVHIKNGSHMLHMENSVIVGKSYLKFLGEYNK